MADINLVPEVAKKEIKKDVGRQQAANRMAMIALLVAGLILLGFFLYWLYIVISGKIVAAQTANAEKKILAQIRKEITHRALVDKMDEASSFISSGKPYSISYDSLTTLINDSKVTLKISEVKGDGKFKISGSVHNSSDFGDLVDALAISETFSDPVLVSLDGVKDKPFTFNIEMIFSKKGISGATASAK